MSSRWRAIWFVASRLALPVVAGAIAGLMLGSLWPTLVVALAAMLGWQLLNLYRLDRWLRHRNRRDPPDVSGVWGEVVSKVVQLHSRKRHHKQRLLQVLRDLRRSIAALPDGVVILDGVDMIRWSNPAASRLLGLRGRADRGLRISTLVREPAFAGYLGRGDFAEPLVLQRTDPACSLALHIVPGRDSQRLLLVRDVSRQMQVEVMRRDFVANVSHELRSPLTVLTGHLELLLADDELDRTLDAPLREMQHQVRRMNAIVNDLLDLSRLDARPGEAGEEEIDVGALCALLRRDVLARPDHPSVVLEVDADVQLLGDRPAIFSAFTNLADNAAKHTPAAGSLLLRWALLADGSARFSVTDTGTGIAAEHLPRLTERFYRVDAGRSRDAGGSGLGLAIVKHVLMHHGATLDIQSTEGTGSTFACLFPARRVRLRSLGADIEPP